MRRRVLIVEDEAVVAETARSMLINLGYDIADMIMHAEDALTAFQTHSFDLVLLDININGNMEGIGLAHELNKMGIPFIFITSYSDQETLNEAKATKPIGYLLKPFTQDSLFATLEVGLERQTEDPVITIKDGAQFSKLRVDDILWLKSDNNYVEVITEQKRFVQLTSLEKFVELLPPDKFIRTHRSYAVNRDKIISADSKHVIIRVDKIPVSRKYRSEVLDNFLNRD